MLGFDVSERTVSRWIRRAPKKPEPAKRWLTFLHNHRELIAAMDFFTVPTFTFGVLYCFFVIAHDQRRILHFNVTRNPTSTWVAQQLREAFPYQSARRFLIFDHDAKFGLDAIAAVRAMGSQAVRTSFRSPWQNGVAERWVGSLPSGSAGSRNRARRATSEAAAVRVRSLLSRGPDASWVEQRNTSGAGRDKHRLRGSGQSHTAFGRITPPLRPGRLKIFPCGTISATRRTPVCLILVTTGDGNLVLNIPTRCAENRCFHACAASTTA